MILITELNHTEMMVEIEELEWNKLARLVATAAIALTASPPIFAKPRNECSFEQAVVHLGEAIADALFPYDAGGSDKT